MISGYPSFRSILYGVLVFQTQKLLLVTNFGKPTSGILNVFAKKRSKVIYAAACEAHAIYEL
jgi:hypothetical protein